MLDQERKRLKDGTDSLDGFINDNEGELDDSSSLEGFIVESDDSDGEYKVKKKKNPSTSSSSRETSKAPSKGNCVKLFTVSYYYSTWFLKKSLYYTCSTGIFPKNGSEITSNFYYIFLYISMYLCCTIVQGHGPNFAKNEKLRILHFYIFS